MLVTYTSATDSASRGARALWRISCTRLAAACGAPQLPRVTPTLLVLAAGLGSRYGGLKQLEAVGPAGATLLDYAVYDAARAGFGAVVFVVRPEMDPAFSDQILPRFVGRVAVRTVHQRFDAPFPSGFVRPPGRTKPWGTAHAVLAADGVIETPFAVANADDFYGQGAYAAVGDFLRAAPPAGPPAYAVVGFPLEATVSEAGSVNRAVCQVSREGLLESVSEVLHIATDGRGGYAGEEEGRARRFTGAELVSMNLWGFTPAFLPQLHEGFAAFLAGGPSGAQTDVTKREYLIPSVVQGLIARGEASVRVLPTDSRWTGMTHPEDRTVVEGRIREMVANGEYPERLW